MLIRKEENDTAIWGVWKITEPINDLMSLLEFTDFSKNISSQKRLLELTAIRILLKSLAKEEKIIEYNLEGKPYLADNSYNISISHTRGYAAVILSKGAKVGIDIEYVSDKVKRVRSKFISEDEYIYENNELIHLLLHWSAKEAMYKAIKMTGVVFKENLHIEKFIPSQSGTFIGKETFTKDCNSFLIHYLVENEFVITIIN
ncbi:MAG: 4'-phosphopantetheinyl transferase superfamily protein [Dysgonomonas sp.]|nr:4'-phosphopantetheinyl transferase superfamily protein [Dysgonomonas sp.]